MNSKLEENIQISFDLIKDKTVVLQFSTGVDSIASYLRLKEKNINPILIYNYYIPHLKMIDNYIDYFEKKTGERVYQFPSTVWQNDIDNALYQLPVEAREKFRNNIGMYGLDRFDKDDFRAAVSSSLGGDVVFAQGLRYTDGIFRMQHLLKNGALFKNMFYPIASFQLQDLKNILDKYGFLLPIEYALWGISFESPRAWSVNLIKEHCPATFRQIKDVFPMIELQGQRSFSALNKHFRDRLVHFSKYSLKKEMYPEW